jgi:TatD DNase family protein
MEKLGWIDSHAHLVDESLYDDLDDVIQQVYNYNVSRILSISMSREEALLNLDLQQKYDIIDVAFGFHPQDAHIITDHEFDDFVEMVKNPNIVALGEIGLDYYWRVDTKEEQKELFIKQIELANLVKKPILIHNRDASEDVLSILKQHPPQYGGVMHCYSSSVEMAFEFIKLNMMISFGGPLTFKNARVPKDVAKAVPIEYLLIETDSPYLTPTPFRGKRNQPAYVSYIGKELSRIKEMPQVEMIRLLSLNYQRLLGQKLDK